MKDAFFPSVEGQDVAKKGTRGKNKDEDRNGKETGNDRE